MPMSLLCRGRHSRSGRIARSLPLWSGPDRQQTFPAAPAVWGETFPVSGYRDWSSGLVIQ